jgi:small subunit ribosomal protein S1
VKVLILEVDAERRRLSLSMKRVEGGQPESEGDVDEGSQLTPNLGLSEEVFAEGASAPLAEEASVEPEGAAEPEPEAAAEPEAEAEAGAAEPEAEAVAAPPEPESE